MSSKISLDTAGEKSRRGPKPSFPPGDVSARADNYRGFLDNIWDRFWPKLCEAETEEDVISRFREIYSGYSDLIPARARTILQLKKDRSFPKRRAAQISFLADSLAGLEVVTPRRSRDICAQERAQAKRAHRILRCEYYIECSCGYVGPSYDKACRSCSTAIPAWLVPATIQDTL
jgi:hypothetical protein